VAGTPQAAQAQKPVVKPAVQVAAEPAEEAAGAEIPCPACGTMISSDAIMCYACGHRLQEEEAATEETTAESETACPACGTMISSDAIMCYACGHRMSADDDKSGKKAPVPAVKKVLKKKVI
jgi:RNA polymerase subunit RPABC4/transcription elongation factor Spt4